MLPAQTEILTHGSTKGKTLEYSGKWGNITLRVAVKRIDANPKLFMLSIQSPIFNINKELVKTEVTDELRKIIDFLEFKESEVKDELA